MKQLKQIARAAITGMVLGGFCLMLLLANVGCSTISGGAALMRGIAQDVEDMAEGARARMAE